MNTLFLKHTHPQGGFGTVVTVGTAFPIVSPMRINDYKDKREGIKEPIERGMEDAASAVPTVPKEESPQLMKRVIRLLRIKLGMPFLPFLKLLM